VKGDNAAIRSIAELGQENTRLRRLLIDLLLQKAALEEAIAALPPVSESSR
jgi:hypothetical protein